MKIKHKKTIYKKHWLDEDVSLDDIYGKPTGNEWKWQAVILCFCAIILLYLLITAK